MAGLVRRERSRGMEPFGAADRFDSLFDDWRSMVMPMRLRSLLFPEWLPEEFIRVDEFEEDGALVVRAELPGIDPDKDVELTVKGGMLHIRAEHKEEDKTEKRGYLRHELRFGSFARSLPLPEGVTEAEVTATYKNGILEIRVPAPTPSPETRIPIART